MIEHPPVPEHLPHARTVAPSDFRAVMGSLFEGRARGSQMYASVRHDRSERQR